VVQRRADLAQLGLDVAIVEARRDAHVELDQAAGSLDDAQQQRPGLDRLGVMAALGISP
jgi:hypothetical protein